MFSRSQQKVKTQFAFTPEFNHLATALEVLRGRISLLEKKAKGQESDSLVHQKHVALQGLYKDIEASIGKFNKNTSAESKKSPKEDIISLACEIFNLIMHLNDAQLEVIFTFRNETKKIIKKSLGYTIWGVGAVTAALSRPLIGGLAFIGGNYGKSFLANSTFLSDEFPKSAQYLLNCLEAAVNIISNSFLALKDSEPCNVMNFTCEWVRTKYLDETQINEKTIYVIYSSSQSQIECVYRCKEGELRKEVLPDTFLNSDLPLFCIDAFEEFIPHQVMAIKCELLNRQKFDMQPNANCKIAG